MLNWLIQRISAVMLAMYTVFLLAFWLMHDAITYLAWQNLFNHEAMKYASLLALLALVAHSWLGIWTISTDYLKITWLRLSVETLVFIGLLLYVVWGIQILWG